MTRYLVLCFLLTTMAGASAADPVAAPDIAALLVKVGLAADDAPPALAAEAPDLTKLCERVSFSRKLKYGENDQNVLDVATDGADTRPTAPLPVLLFVTGDSFADENSSPDAADPVQDAAICYAARHGMVGVRVTYRRAPSNPWPSGARDVAAATSWVHQNIDLFGGNRDEIVAFGYSVGAFHVASLLAHPEKSYFGADASQYDARSAFPGILNIETPILLAWAAADPPRLVAQGEKLKELLCHSPTHCPHTTVLSARDSLASVFGPDASGNSLAGPTLELIREIEARGLP
jgi:dienelactone hydrolase